VKHARDAIFDLAVNRAAAFTRSTGASLEAGGVALETWQARTRFASRVSLEAVRTALESRPDGEGWHWVGGESGEWLAGKPRTP
jgi:uncharacterized protein YfiM (DUF2279 family)